MNLRTGGFHCWGCPAKGGSVFDYVMLRDGCTFKEAAQSLGCWDSAAAPAQRKPGVLVNYLAMDFTSDGKAYRVAVEDEPRTYRDKIKRFHRAACDRLFELEHGASEIHAGEREVCEERIALAIEELTDVETGLTDRLIRGEI